jgi:hypothetical protein
LIDLSIKIVKQLMSTYSIEANHGHQFDAIFRNPTYEKLTIPGTDRCITSRGHASIRKVTTAALLFIGINPAFGEDAKKENAWYGMTKSGDKGYWSSFGKVANGIEWTHLDLLVCRETKQQHISGLLKQDHGLDFIWEQLEISKEIIVKAKPKIIVVCNTLARTFLGKDISTDKKSNIWLGFKFEPDEEIGTDRIVEGPLAGTPVFFSSMLTGQRALDNGSKDRLIWHIKQVYQSITPKT